MRSKTNKETICRVLGWSDYDYNRYLYNSSHTYLELNIHGQANINMITATTSWWMWWERQWQISDQRFINHLRIADDQEYNEELQPYLEDLYRLEHAPEDLQEFPSAVVRKMMQDETKGILTLKRL